MASVRVCPNGRSTNDLHIAVSVCHSTGDGPISQKCYPSRWWNSVFPHPVSELTNGAMRRTDSRYFCFCSVHHLPDHTDPSSSSLILMTNRMFKLVVLSHFFFFKKSDAASIEQFETLTHSLLTRPDDTAVILLGRFNTQTYQTHGYAGPDHWHNTLLGSMTFPVGVPNPSFSRTTFATRPLSLNTLQTSSSRP